nr:hypothetical protein [Tanacetum cinerariifolium]
MSMMHNESNEKLGDAHNYMEMIRELKNMKKMEDKETQNGVFCAVAKEERKERVVGNSRYSGNAQRVTGNNATVQRIPRTSTNAWNTSMVKWCNCNEKGHLARVCPKPRVKDTNFFKEQILSVKKDEAGITLAKEENDFLLADVNGEDELEELNASCIMMKRIQTVNNDYDAEPSYDSDFANEENSENIKQDTSAHDHKYVESESLMRNVQLEADKTKEEIKIVKDENALLTMKNEK